MIDHEAMFQPIEAEAEKLAAHLHHRWREHEAVIAGWYDDRPRAWATLDCDQKRHYRAMALAAIEFANADDAAC